MTIGRLSGSNRELAMATFLKSRFVCLDKESHFIVNFIYLSLSY